MVPNSNSYWYSVLGIDTCFNASQYRTIHIRMSAAAGAQFTIGITEYSSDSCGKDCDECTLTPKTIRSSNLGVSFDGSMTDIYIPLAGFTGIILTRLKSVVLQSFTSAGTVVVRNIQFLKSGCGSCKKNLIVVTQ